MTAPNRCPDQQLLLWGIRSFLLQFELCHQLLEGPWGWSTSMAQGKSGTPHKSEEDFHLVHIIEQALEEVV